MNYQDLSPALSLRETTTSPPRGEVILHQKHLSLFDIRRKMKNMYAPLSPWGRGRRLWRGSGPYLSSLLTSPPTGGGMLTMTTLEKVILKPLISLSLILFQIHPTQANDSAGAVGAGGIEFHKTEGIVMEKEDLFISPSLIKVLYIFKNKTDKDITVDLFFPLPIQSEISAQKTWDKEILDEMNGQNIQNNPEHDRSYLFKEVPFEDFSVIVDGKKTVFKTEIRALQKGKDVTNLFHQNNLPFSPVLATCDYPMQTEKDNEDCAERIKRYKNLGLLSPEGKVLWQKQVHHYWSQIFPKGKEVKIEHSYRPARGSFFFVPDPKRPFVEVLIEQLLSRGSWLEKFCPWQSIGMKGNFIPWLTHEFQKASKPTKSEESGLIMFYEVDYILTTGANWEGPIRDFTLTVEYPKGGTVASCWPFDQNEIKNLGKNQLQFHQNDFKPEQDLKILFGVPYAGGEI